MACEPTLFSTSESYEESIAPHHSFNDKNFVQEDIIDDERSGTTALFWDIT